MQPPVQCSEKKLIAYIEEINKKYLAAFRFFLFFITHFSVIDGANETRI